MAKGSVANANSLHKMVKKGFLKRIVAVPNVNPLDIRTDSNHDFLVLDKEKVT